MKDCVSQCWKQRTVTGIEMGQNLRVTRDCRKVKTRWNGRQRVGADESEAGGRTGSWE